MNAYVFQATLLCEECAQATRTRFESLEAQNPWRQCRHGVISSTCGDSDCWPRGPYPRGGGEADSPQHCGHCGLFLENPLTSDGEEYVRKTIAHPGVTFAPLGEWRAYYAYLWEDPNDDTVQECWRA